MNLKSFFPFYKNYVKAMSRISALEMALAYVLRSPEYHEENGWAFNGQQHRQKIFCDLVRAFQFGGVFETGTFMGDTTGYMRSRVDCPVSTCEANPIFQSVAMSRLKSIPGIEFTLGDSRKFLEDHLSRTSIYKSQNAFFFYLDAHWHEDLPLEDEICIITKNVNQCVIMIDDFAVPDDSGYTYDNYGKGKSLDMATFGKVFAEAGMQNFFPALQGNKESGAKRGCVILAKGNKIVEKIAVFPTLRTTNSFK
jgi:hypothetical protein